MLPRRVLRLMLCGLAVAGAGCSSLLFYPEPGQPFTPREAGLDYRDVYFTTADGVRLHAWWLPAKAGMAVKGTVLHLHGNGGNLAWHLGGSGWLPRRGWQVLLLDYRGYGLSEGAPALPEVYRDLEAAFAWLESEPAASGRPLAVLGQSLGGALAVRFLARQPQRRARVSALVLDGVPASYREVARHMLAGSWLTWPLQVPLSWLVPDGDSAVASMPELRGLPVLVYHSRNDSLVPLANGLRLYQAASPPKLFQATRGEHVQTFADPAWRALMLRFLANPQGASRLAESSHDETSR